MLKWLFKWLESIKSFLGRLEYKKCPNCKGSGYISSFEVNDNDDVCSYSSGPCIRCYSTGKIKISNYRKVFRMLFWNNY